MTCNEHKGAESPAPANAPVMVAWNAYTSTDEFANSLRWAVHAEHSQGSMWAAFYAGFYASAVNAAEALATKDAELSALRGEVERLKSALGTAGWPQAAARRRVAEVFSLRRLGLRQKERLLAHDRVLIRSNGTFWRANRAGYTDLANAAEYTGQEAWAATYHCGPEKEVHYHLLAALTHQEKDAQDV